MQFVLFNLSTRTYGVDITSVLEIILLQHSTPIPEMPNYMEGVINLRGKIIPVIDLKKFFNFPQTEQTDQNRIVIIEIKEAIFGMIVDEVQEVINITIGMIEAPPDAFADIDKRYIDGIVNRGEEVIVILNGQKILEERGIGT